LAAIENLIQNESTGLLFRPGDVSALAGTLLRLLDDAVARKASDPGKSMVRRINMVEDHRHLFHHIRKALPSHEFDWMNLEQERTENGHSGPSERPRDCEGNSFANS